MPRKRIFSFNYEGLVSIFISFPSDPSLEGMRLLYKILVTQVGSSSPVEVSIRIGIRGIDPRLVLVCEG